MNTVEGTLHTDGGARGNPGPAGIGYVLKVGPKKITYGKHIGETTNNQAEYQALLAGLTQARDHGVTDLTCYLDSELIVKQLAGEYRVKHADLRPHFEQVQRLVATFERISFHHVPRIKNREADALVNEALDAHKKSL